MSLWNFTKISQLPSPAPPLPSALQVHLSFKQTTFHFISLVPNFAFLAKSQNDRVLILNVHFGPRSTFIVKVLEVRPSIHFHKFEFSLHIIFLANQEQCQYADVYSVHSQRTTNMHRSVSLNIYPAFTCKAFEVPLRHYTIGSIDRFIFLSVAH